MILYRPQRCCHQAFAPSCHLTLSSKWAISDKSTRKLTPEEELAGIREPMSQFERALEELGVEVIHACSPQAKGRVERLFGVLQDRLIKEMRLKGIQTKDEANQFLTHYLPRYSKRFRVCPAHDADAHVKLPRQFNLDRYLCIKTDRTVRNDNTIAHNGKLYQLAGDGKAKKVTVEERLDGSLHIVSAGVDVHYKEIKERAMKHSAPNGKKRAYHRPVSPPKDHPWRRWNPSVVGKRGMLRYGSV